MPTIEQQLLNLIADTRRHLEYVEKTVADILRDLAQLPMKQKKKKKKIRH